MKHIICSAMSHITIGYRQIAYLLLLFCTFNAQANLRIAWFVPIDLADEKIIFGEGNAFWKHTHKFTAKAAQDLGVELVIVDFNRNRFDYVERALEVAAGKHGKIDAVIFYNFLNKGSKVLDILERANISSISIITNFLNDSLLDNTNNNSVGRPRGLFKHWLGEFRTDDKKAGKELTHYLAAHYAAQNPTDKTNIPVIAIAGERTHSASFLRKQGLNEALNSLTDFHLAQLIEGSWSRNRAKEVLPKLLKRHGDVKIIWCANDELALGAIDGLKDANLDPTQYIIGGVDWNSDALKAIELKQMRVSYGGHFLQGAYAMTLLYDYLNGKDFAADIGVTFNLDLQKMDESIVHLFKHNNQYFNLEQINFLKMSRHYQQVHLQHATNYSFNYLQHLTANVAQD